MFIYKYLMQIIFIQITESVWLIDKCIKKLQVDHVQFVDRIYIELHNHIDALPSSIITDVLIYI